ncbi:MAG: wax ester/triacylglycerol synthase family O-acyltransferase [Knoellia sp.]
MRRLSGLDAAFLALETPTSTGHVGGLSIVEARTAPEPLSLARITRLMESRIGAVPVLRQRLMTVPLGLDQPVWVDDVHFDIGYHLRELALPRPGSDEQLAEQVARIHARPLDRSRPLWETYLISGLKGGRAAVYTKVHHAAVDGVSGAELLMVLFDLTAEDRPAEEVTDFEARPEPRRSVLGARAVARLAWRPVEIARLATQAIRVIPSVSPVVGPLVAGMIGLGRGSDADGQVLASPAPLVAPQTPFNVAISPHRRFAFGSVSLADVKIVKNAFGVSVNDVVMAISAGAMRSWLIAHDALPEGPLVAMVPVSIRAKSSGFTGNKVSAMLAALPTNVEDPVERLGVTRQATAAAKAQQAFIPQGLVDDVTDFAPPALMARAARVAFASKVLHRLPAFNVVISNIPGPNVPVYLAGAKLLAHYPVSVVTDGVAFNITLIGYLDQLHFGLIAAREVMPDIDDVMADIDRELALLVRAAKAHTKAATRARKKTDASS